MASIQRVCDLKTAVYKYNNAHVQSPPITSLKPRQIDALYSIKDKKDTFIVLPTGYGKSLIFELIPFYINCKVIILEPLNSIITQLCEKHGERIVNITKNYANVDSLYGDNVCYITGHPENILNSDFLEQLVDKSWVKENIVIVVDEAHCILQWQDDFRPAYKNIKNLKAIFQKFTMVAMTATVNSKSVKQIRKDLQMKGTLINCTPLLRKNISLAVKPRPGYKKDETQTAPYDYIFKQLYEEYLLRVENKHDYPVTIVYTKLIWCSRAIDLAKILLGDHMYIGDPSSKNSVIVQYHSPQDAEVNQYILEALGRDDNHIRVIFATIALGMGADLKKVKRVIHAGAPSSAEEYIQEIGRAGRTGGEAESVIYVNAMDLSSQIVSAEMKNYLKQTEVCRRKFLSDYLNCPLEPAEYKCCDLCSKDSDTEVKGQNQVVRFLVKQALKQYVEADVSGEITFHLNDILIERITETYEMVPLDSVENYYKLPTFVAESVKVILGTFK